MSGQRNALILHSTVTRWSTLVMDVELARSLQFDGLELSAEKVERYLSAGYAPDELKTLLAGLDIPAIGFILDVERRGDDRQALLAEADRICRLAHLAGAKAVQAITGPVDVRTVEAFRRDEPNGGYMGVLAATAEDQIAITAEGLAAVADVAASYGLTVYFEGLGWTPVNTLDSQLATVRSANRKNVKLVIDFWHCYVSGETPDRVAQLPRELLYGVHICDSLDFAGGIPVEPILRNVSTGAGVLHLREWTDAVKSTGYDDWWSCELFCTRDQQGHSPSVAGRLRDLMVDLVR
jgi:sugar phosphate isomerase/epimerase